MPFRRFLSSASTLCTRAAPARARGRRGRTRRPSGSPVARRRERENSSRALCVVTFASRLFSFISLVHSFVSRLPTRADVNRLVARHHQLRFRESDDTYTHVPTRQTSTRVDGASGSSARRGKWEAARAFLDTLLSSDSFDRTALEGLKDARFSEGRCRCAFPVGVEKTNRYGTLHGGCIATLVDVVSTAALVTQSDHPGVSVNIDVAYMSPGPAGDEVQVDARVTKVGVNLAFMEVLITSGGKVVAKGATSSTSADKRHRAETRQAVMTGTDVMRRCEASTDASSDR